MKIVVTGGAGFIGSHLVDRLMQDKAVEVLVFDNFFRGRMENLAQHSGNPRLWVWEGDIRDQASLLAAFQNADQVYHLAAQSNVMGAVTDLDYSFSTNVIGTYNVLNAAHTVRVKRVVFTSSREVYGEARYLPVDENHPIGSKNPYGASKVAGEQYCRVMSHLFDLQVSVLRLSNVYGPRDFGRVIPLWLSRVAQNDNLIVYGGQQLIDFVWIDQVVEALMRSASLDLGHLPVNVGSGQGTPILDLARRILDVTGTDARLEIQPARSAEVVRFTADVSHMQSVLGLQPPQDPLFGLEYMAPVRAVTA